jgi:hypothetical protein
MAIKIAHAGACAVVIIAYPCVDIHFCAGKKFPPPQLLPFFAVYVAFYFGYRRFILQIPYHEPNGEASFVDIKTIGWDYEAAKIPALEEIPKFDKVRRFDNIQICKIFNPRPGVFVIVSGE